MERSKKGRRVDKIKKKVNTVAGKAGNVQVGDQ